MLPLIAEHLEPEQRFVFIAMELQREFPDLDLQFNLLCGTTTARCLIPEHASDHVEISLLDKELSATLHDAIFNIKELAQLFDA